MSGDEDQRNLAADDGRAQAGLSWRHSVVARSRNRAPSGRDGGMTSVRSGPAGARTAAETIAAETIATKTMAA